MIRDFYLDRDNRNDYLRFMVNVLVDKYFVSKTRLARGMGVNTTYFYDFSAGRRMLLDRNLNKIEDFINDLYEPIILFEIEQNMFYFKELSRNSRKKV